MSYLEAVYIWIALLVTKGVWVYGAFCLVTKTNVVARIKSFFKDEDEMSDEDIFNMYG
jgi:hypothetical protein